MGLRTGFALLVVAVQGEDGVKTVPRERFIAPRKNSVKRSLLIKRKTNISGLAEKLGTSQGNLSNKLKRDNFSEKELIEIGNALDCDFIGNFKMRDTGDTI